MESENERHRAALRFLSSVPTDLKTFHELYKSRKLQERIGNDESIEDESAHEDLCEVKMVVHHVKDKEPRSGVTRSRKTRFLKSAYQMRELKPRVVLQKRIFVVDKTGNIPLSMFSVLPYRKEGKLLSVGYNAAVGRRRSRKTSSSQQAVSKSDDLRNVATLRIEGIQQPDKEEEVSYRSLLEEAYDRSFRLQASSGLENPEWKSGSHRTVLTFPSYMVSIISYTKPTELKKDLNDRFREKFPKVNITLSKCRSLKNAMQRIATTQNVERAATARALAYFDHLVMSGKVIKENRRHCAGVCLLLSAKVNSDLKSAEVSRLISGIEHGLKVGRHDLVLFEFPVFAALQFSLITFPS